MNFKIKKLDNIKFSHKELVEYYETIKKDYQHLRWDSSMINDHKEHKVNQLYSWAVQSNLKDPNKPCAPYHIDASDAVDPNDNFNIPTDLVFGFGQKIIETFPNIRQTVISGHPPGTRINFHVDNDEFVKIHIPIYTNDKSYFDFENERFLLEEGSAYLINTSIVHGTENLGTTDRVHLIFKIKMSDVENILNNDWILDINYLDFDIIELTNIKFNYSDLENYWKTVKNNFSYLQWTIKEKHLPPDKFAQSTLGIYGYGILSNLDNVDLPCNPPGNSNKDSKNKIFNKPTKLVFGIAEKILQEIPNCEELSITAHPPNTGIPPHIDKDNHVRIHLPIYSNSQSWFCHGSTKINLTPGKAYIVNTKRIHSTMNEGICDRIHLMFKIPYSLVNQFLNKRIIL